MDFITDLPPSNGFDSLLVVVDHGLTKGVILEPCHKTITAEQTATILVRRVFSRFGVPDKIISDRVLEYNAPARSVSLSYDLMYHYTHFYFRTLSLFPHSIVLL